MTATVKELESHNLDSSKSTGIHQSDSFVGTFTAPISESVFADYGLNHGCNPHTN